MKSGLAMDAEAIRAAITDAFRGVTLGRGISLRQAQAIDAACMEEIPGPEFFALRRGEITENWAAIPVVELDRDCIAHLDAEGFRYYIPAFMLRLLELYEPVEMRVIGTISALCPDKNDKTSWGYHMSRYKVLSPQQMTAVALFMQALPSLIELEDDDGKRVARAIKDYWHQYLPRRKSKAK